MGHTVVITGCECKVRNSAIYITKLFTRDPAPDVLMRVFNGRIKWSDRTGINYRNVFSHFLASSTLVNIFVLRCGFSIRI
jgi:hypothetical protein